MLGISQDSIEENAAFASKYHLPFPLLSDTTGEVCKAFGTCGESTPNRIRRNTYIIDPNGAIRQVYEDANPEDQADIVLKFLKGTSKTVQQKEVVPANQHKPGANFYEEALLASQKGKDAHMSDEKKELENSRGDEVAVRAPQELKGMGETSSVSEITPSSSTPADMVSQHLSSTMPGQVYPSQGGSGPPLVFALGTLGYDFGTEARRDSLMQHMDEKSLLAYLEENPSQAAAVIWTLSLDATTIYAVQPGGSFASLAYERLRQFLHEQSTEGVERVSIPGVIVGQVRLMSGQVIPVIWPEMRGMYSWSTSALVEAVCGSPPKEPGEKATAQDKKSYSQKAEAYADSTQPVRNFLERVYSELINLGTTPQDRAINYAATNAFNAAKVFESALKDDMELDTIEVERSPLCREGSDCWDVKLTFFNPDKVFEQARKVYRFTVDVSDVVPVMVGAVRSWSVR